MELQAREYELRELIIMNLRFTSMHFGFKGVIYS